jgi:hypothetical protein
MLATEGMVEPGIKYKFTSESVIIETSQTVKETTDFQLTADGKL